jgi:hypothetical protein
LLEVWAKANAATATARAEARRVGWSFITRLRVNHSAGGVLEWPMEVVSYLNEDSSDSPLFQALGPGFVRDFLYWKLCRARLVASREGTGSR